MTPPTKPFTYAQASAIAEQARYLVDLHDTRLLTARKGEPGHTRNSRIGDLNAHQMAHQNVEEAALFVMNVLDGEPDHGDAHEALWVALDSVWINYSYAYGQAVAGDVSQMERAA